MLLVNGKTNYHYWLMEKRVTMNDLPLLANGIDPYRLMDVPQLANGFTPIG